jgi:hypothetical protein
VWENDGAAAFDSLGPLLGTSGGVSSSAGDVDGDGDLDVFICGLENNPTTLCWNRSCTTGIEGSDGLPPGLVLSGNSPNPFSSVTRITYTVSVPARVLLAIYDVRGRKLSTLVDEFQGPGTYSAAFDGAGLASGVYMYRLVAGRTARSGSMLLTR